MKSLQEIKSAERSGFTMVELLVSIGILSLLMAISVPAVQQARESSRRANCVSNMKQIALAAQNFESTHGTFPFVGANRSQFWIDSMRTELEMPKRPKSRNKNAFYPLLACPSDPLSKGRPSPQYSSYLINNGRGDKYEDGVRGHITKKIRTRDVTDGLSNTAFAAERLVMPEITTIDWTPYPHFYDRLIRTTAQVHADIDDLADECQNRPKMPMQSLFIYDSYNHILTPNQPSCLNGIVVEKSISVTATSHHKGGVNVAFADGSLHFISDSIDRKVWRSLGTRNGNESVSLSNF